MISAMHHNSIYFSRREEKEHCKRALFCNKTKSGVYSVNGVQAIFCAIHDTSLSHGPFPKSHGLIVVNEHTVLVLFRRFTPTNQKMWKPWWLNCGRRMCILACRNQLVCILLLSPWWKTFVDSSEAQKSEVTRQITIYALCASDVEHLIRHRKFAREPTKRAHVFITFLVVGTATLKRWIDKCFYFF